MSVLHIYAFPYAIYKVRFMSQAPLIHQVEMGSWLKSVTDSANQRVRNEHTHTHTHTPNAISLT